MTTDEEEPAVGHPPTSTATSPYNTTASDHQEQQRLTTSKYHDAENHDITTPSEEGGATPADEDHDHHVHHNEEDVPHTNTNTTSRNNNKQRIITRVTILLLLLGFIIFVIIDSSGEEQWIKKTIQAFLSWIEQNPIAGIFSAVGVYIIATVLFIPGSIFTLGCGFVFANVFGLGLGLLFSTIAVFLGASIGATIAFLLGRYLFQESIQNFSNRYQVFQAIDTALETQGLKIMILLRLSPIIPFNAINYILGLTSVLLKDYVLACFAMLPGTLLYTFLGSSAGSIVESASSGSGNLTLTIVIIVLGVLFGILSIIATTFYAKKELKKIMDAQQDQEQE